MKPADMLHQMCHSLLEATDVKALCKARGLAPEAAKSPGILETLFLSSQGVSEVLNSLEPNEVALLHLLKSSNTPVDVSFFAAAYGDKGSRGTFNQRYQGTFAKVKQRLIRGGVLLLCEGRKREYVQESKLERTRFALPDQFLAHLPPLIASPREFDGSGDWKPNVARDTLLADLGEPRKEADDRTFQVEAGELQLDGKRFQAAQLLQRQQSGWKQAVQTAKKVGDKGAGNAKRPDEAALCILSELADGCWADVEQIADPLRIFCDNKVDGAVICEAGWEWGLLAKRKADGKTWYRPAPQQPHVAPQQYLTPHTQEGCVSVDLTTVPLNSIEQIVQISDQRLSPAGGHSLLLTPNFVKLGRADDKLLATEAVQWLVEHTPPFAEARVTLDERRGKTILHEGVTIARVSDLSLKVAIEKKLGSNVVSLKNDFIAFPCGLLADVERVVKKSGHVVKEVTAK
jgi:hypothetical protein